MRAFVLGMAAAGAVYAYGLSFEPDGHGGWRARERGRAFAVSREGVSMRGYGWRLRHVQTGPPGEPLERLPGTVNYILGRDPARWRTGVPAWGRLRFRGIYPGVDLIYYGRNGRLEYDFLLAPGADPRRIEMEWTTPPHLTAGGDLQSGVLTLRRPAAWQQTGATRQAVAVRYVLRGRRRVGLEIGRYDRARPLVIDPVLVYSTYVGGRLNEQARAVTVDAAGNTYMTGVTASADFPSRSAAMAGFRGGGTDAFVVKIRPDGTLAYSTFLGGAGADAGNAIAVDSSGAVFVAGNTGSADFPVSATAAQRRYGGGASDAFLVRLNPQGTALLYATYLGGANTDAAAGVALDTTGNAYVGGQTNSSNFPVTEGVFQSARFGTDFDVFVTKINPASPELVYSTFLGGRLDDIPSGIAVDRGGNAYITGATASSGYPTTPAQASPCGRGNDAFFTKLNSTGGRLIFSTCLGGSADDFGNAVAVDSGGNAWIAGTTKSDDFPVSSAVLQRGCGRGRDAFVARFDPAASRLVYATCLGGSGDDDAFALAVDGSGNAYAAGTTGSGDFPVTPDAVQANPPAGLNAWTAKINANGTALLTSTYLGGAGDDRGLGIALAPDGSVVLAGGTTSTDFPVAGKPVRDANAGGEDAFLARLQFALQPRINGGGVVSGASSLGGPLSPGMFVSVFGADLATGTQSASVAPLPATLGGTTVTVNGTPAPLYSVSPTQVNFQMPAVAPGPGTVTVSVNGTATGAEPITVADVSPSIFLQPGTQRAIAQNQDLSLNGPGNAAAPGSAIIVYITGIGPLDNPVDIGAAAPDSPLSRALLPVTATIGGQTATVLFAGLTPESVGLAQANLLVPNVAAGDQPVVVTFGRQSSNQALVSVGK